jgi:hypothetical protein
MKQKTPTTVVLKPTKAIGLAEVKKSLYLAIASKLVEIKEMYANEEAPQTKLSIFRYSV